MDRAHGHPGPIQDSWQHVQLAGFERIVAAIGRARTCVICAHTDPDGDALGSQLALAELIRQQWPSVAVTCLRADDAPVPQIYRFLPLVEELVEPAGYDETPDLFIAVDLSQASRLNRAEPIMRRARERAILDHHPCEEPFADAYVIRPGAAAAAVIVHEFALFLGAEVSRTMAQNLLCGIITDTGRFQYQNCDEECFECASLLVRAGASPSEISLNVYQSARLQYLHLKSVVMGRITTFEQGRIAYSYATVADLERTGAHLDECDGLIDVVRTVEGAEVALFLKPSAEGVVRGNLRSKGPLDVSKVAAAVGGGGHRAAAGFTFVGTVDEALSKVLPMLRALFIEDAGGDGR